jgi:2-desacetyl-2-hydroxyethyl bacteriochlorophyllide A dehydrogenase
MVQTRELWFTAPNQVELRLGPMPRAQGDRVLARALASGLSQGTEMLLFSGEGCEPFDPSLDEPGAPRYPRRYGYSWVGEVIDIGDAVSGLSVGDRVFALASHGDVHDLPSDAARRIDPDIPATRAVLAANLETAVNCVWDSGVSLGDRVVVFGAGVVGLLVAWLCARVTSDVRVFEPAEPRHNMARRLGLVAAASPDTFDLDADIVIEASGKPSALDAAVACAGQEGRVVVVSNYGARRHELNLGDRFHRRRLTIRSSQVSAIPAERRARWSVQRRFATVQSLLRAPELDELVDHVVDFANAPDAYRQLRQTPGNWLQTVFVYPAPREPL